MKDKKIFIQIDGPTTSDIKYTIMLISIWDNLYKPENYLLPNSKITDIKLGRTTDCPHCKFLIDTFLLGSESTERDYYLMTEVFLYLHGGDVCNYSTENKIQPLEVKPIEGIEDICQPFKTTQD